MSLLSMWDFEILPGKKLSKNSPILLRALELIQTRRQIKIEHYEEVIDPLELILTCREVMTEFEKRGGNNNPKGINQYAK